MIEGSHIVYVNQGHMPPCSLKYLPWTYLETQEIKKRYVLKEFTIDTTPQIDVYTSDFVVLKIRKVVCA